MTEDLDLDGLQANVIVSEIFDQLTAPCTPQRPIKIIDPGVVRTGDSAGDALTLQQFMSPVLTDVVKSLQATPGIAGHKDALAL